MTNKILGRSMSHFGRGTCWLVLTFFSCGLPFSTFSKHEYQAVPLAKEVGRSPPTQNAEEAVARDSQSCESLAPLHIVEPPDRPAFRDFVYPVLSHELDVGDLTPWEPPSVSSSATIRAASSNFFFFADATSAEFTAQSAVLLDCHELVESAPQLFGDIVEALCGRLGILALVADEHEQEAALELLEGRDLETTGVTFFHVDHDTMWVRDYGPFVRPTTDGRAAVLDARYSDGNRPHDDRVPEEIASLFDLHLIRVPLELDGGNFLSNGAGLCLSTLRLRDHNGLSLNELGEHLRTYYGCNETVFLEPLRGEESGHVDMFATFASENIVVVGRYNEEVDPENAALLNRNAARLAMVRCSKGPLNVIRIPMPQREEGAWTTYTNVIYANGALLVPVYGPEESSDRAEALSTYGSLLPGWDIIPIDVTALSDSGGALHCLSMNLPTLGPSADLPEGCSMAVSTPLEDDEFFPIRDHSSEDSERHHRGSRKGH